MKRSLSLLSAALIAIGLHAHEGMWLLNKLKQINEAEMQKLGFKLTAEDIYDINKSSLKDGIVRLGGGFCSGEMVSAEGLFLTNHHCGFDAVQGLSSLEHDYLTDGFWAMTREQELPAGFSVSFLQKIEDVSEGINSQLSAGMTEEARAEKIEELAGKMIEEAGTANGTSVDFKVMFEGNEFYLFYYKTYRDIRLAGVPPSAIGKFGGDTDNWMWPRHTGDFSMFRVYMGPDGEPADYSTANIPFAPKWHFPVSIAGVKEGDFAMIMGYPGSTDRFLSSDGVKLGLDEEYPSRVKIRGKKLELMKQDMDASDAVRIQYASKYASISNYWKYFIGQSRGLKRLHVYDKKKEQEEALLAWVNADASRKGKYGEFLSLLKSGYAERTKYEKAQAYMQEAGFGSEMVTLGLRMMQLKQQLVTDPKDAPKIAALVAGAQRRAEDFWKDYNPATDQKVTAAMFQMMHADMAPEQQPSVMAAIQKKYKGNFDLWAKTVFSSSILTNKARMDAFLAKPTLKVLEKDLGMQAAESSLANYRALAGSAAASQTDLDNGYRLMVAAMREKEPTKSWYPNANSTMRLTYGTVGSYIPMDGAKYLYETTAKGILEKEDNTNDEFIVPARQHELLTKKDYGRYADEKGELITCFISNNDITGGNSGSGVFNGNGELIGIAFDGNWEAMSGDIAFEPELQRTISVDIRYVLWTIDTYAGAGHLVKEMTVVERKKEEAKVEVPAEVAPVAPVKPAKPMAPVKKS